MDAAGSCAGWMMRYGVDVLLGRCATVWLAARGGCYGPAGGVQAEGVAVAVGTVWVVALGAGMLQQLWVWGSGCGVQEGCVSGAVGAQLAVAVPGGGTRSWGCEAIGPIGLAVASLPPSHSATLACLTVRPRCKAP